MKETKFGWGVNDYGKTEPVGAAAETNGGAGATEPVGISDWDKLDQGSVTQEAPNSSFTMPTGTFTSAAPNGFTAPNSFTAPVGGFNPDQPSVTEPATPGNVRGFLPVVGWLVCIDGVDRGRDYRIHNGMNKIGRDPSNDICISGDMQISRETHVRLAFDSQECVFFVAPANGMNLARLNNKVLMMATELHAGDVLTVGTSKLMFVPFCTETFSWEKHE